jgi:hypothetical protein
MYIDNSIEEKDDFFINKESVDKFKVGDMIFYLGGDDQLIGILDVGKDYELLNIREYVKFYLLQIKLYTNNTEYNIYLHSKFFCTNNEYRKIKLKKLNKICLSQDKK